MQSAILYQIKQITSTECNFKLTTWFLSSPNNCNINNFKVYNLMSCKRSIYPMDQGGWNIWLINKRQTAQKIWLFNRYLTLNQQENKKLSSSYFQSWSYQIQNQKKANGSSNISSKFLQSLLIHWDLYRRLNGIIDNNRFKPFIVDIGIPQKLTSIYDKLVLLNQDIPKTEFQKTLRLCGYSYNRLFINIQSEILDPKCRNTIFRFHSRCLPINFYHNTTCKLCGSAMDNDPYGHLFLTCTETRRYININKLSKFIFEHTGKNKNWRLTNNKLYHKTLENQRLDHHVHNDYNDPIHPKHFNWCYKDNNFDLDRPIAYKNIITVVFHQTWIWICNRIFNPDYQHQLELDYDLILSKWNKIIILEYIRRFKILKTSQSLNPSSCSIHNNDINIQVLAQFTELRTEIRKQFFIKNNNLPNLYSVYHHL